MNARLLFTHALSPLHAGTGQGVGVIDLPIAREKATGIPYLPGSSIKGSLKDLYPNDVNKNKVYGPDTDKADEGAGAAQFSDQKLLLLPIRCLAGTFAWATSPYLLKRFLRDVKDMQLPNIPVAGIPTISSESCSIPQPFQMYGDQVQTKLKMQVGNEMKVVMEDLDLNPIEDGGTATWAMFLCDQIFPDFEWKKMFGERFCIVSDDVLGFLLDTATEITARIKLLDDLKTVQKGGLWYEEALPTETILYGLVLATPPPNAGLNNDQVFDVVKKSIQPVVQLGGKATVGRGLCRLQFQA